MNPYRSPNAELLPLVTEITDGMVEQLIENRDTIKLAFYDVSDCQLYGHKNGRFLTGELAEKAAAAGVEPSVFQAVHWWCLVYIPIVPLGTFVVMQDEECDDPDGDADQYRCIPVAIDPGQIVTHYVGAALGIAAVAGLIWSAVSWS